METVIVADRRARASGSSSCRLAALDARVRARLEVEIEKELARAVASDVDVRRRGGAAPDRRRRQAVPAAARRARGGVRRSDVAAVAPAALVVELTHLATLYHDDVMDEADLRRGAQSANARWDNSVAILTGDFLFARASDIVADLGPDAVRIQAQTFARLVQGQIRETIGPARGEDPLAHYLSVRRRQDRVADRDVGAVRRAARGRLAGGRPGHADRVRRGDRHRLPAVRRHHRHRQRDRRAGKTAGTDLREGVPTLPTLIARSRPTTGRRPSCERCCRRPIADDGQHAEALATAARATRRWTRPGPRSGVAPTQPAALLRDLPDIASARRAGRPLRPGHHPPS